MIKAVYTGGEFLESVVPGEEVGLILQTTSFYAEQGGQVNISVNLLCISLLISFSSMLVVHLSSIIMVD